MSPRSCASGRVEAVLGLAAWAGVASAGTPLQDKIYSDDFDGFPVLVCDADLPSDSSDAMQYAAALELCRTTTEQGADWGVISAALSLSSGSGLPAPQSRALRPAFGSGNAPRAGSTMVVLSSGSAAAPDQVNPGFSAFEPGFDTGTTSTAPADWLAANGGTAPTAPGCPSLFNATTRDSAMLTLRLRVPGNARSFSLSANFFGADYDEYVCGAFNDGFVALLDSHFDGTPANPADKNLATYTAPNSNRYPLGVNLARDNTGLFTQCMNGTTGCENGNLDANTACTGIEGLVGTGMGEPGSFGCNANSLVGGATGWLVIRGNVVPGETIQLRLALWDTADAAFDSLILLDRFQWSSVTVMPGTTLD